MAVRNSPEPSLRTRAFFDGSLVLLFLAMLVVRLRIRALSPLSSEQVLLWLGAGLFEDFAVAGLSAAFLLALSRWLGRSSWARVLLGVFAVSLLAAHIVWSEVLIFFGQAPRFDALLSGLNPTFAHGAFQVKEAIRVSLFLSFFSLLLFLAARRAARAQWAWSGAWRLFLLGAAATLLLILPVPIHRRETAHNPFVAAIEIWNNRPARAQAQAGSLRPPRVDPIAVRQLAPPTFAREYLGDGFPLAHRPRARSASAARLPAGIRPNFVFLLLEGVRAEEVGAYDGHPPGLTPNLDRLAREGIVIERAYSCGMHTPDAELGFWYGIYPNPESAVMTQHPGVRLTGLPELLRASGWRTFAWIHNGDQTFYGRDRFYLPRGFRMVDGRDFPRSDPRTNWGYSDRALARRAVEALGKAAEPFAALVLTVSNHHPFQVPSDARSSFPGLSGARRGFIPLLGSGELIGRHTVPMLQTIHYTDEAVGDFFRLASAERWFSKTVFIISGDHGLSIIPYARPLATLSTLTELRHRVPLLIYSPMLSPGRVRGPASQADLAETLLGLAGITLPRSGIGRDLLDPEPGDSDRPVVTWSAEGRRVSIVGDRRIYQANVGEVVDRGSPLPFEQEVLFDPETDREGKRNLIDQERSTAAEYRRLASVYLDVYPWLLLSGRSGVPDAALSAASEKAANAGGGR